MKVRLQTRQITLAGILSALTLVLGLTPIGFIPVPNLSGALTIVHLPVILAGMIGGPIIGAFAGLVFGLMTYFRFMPDVRVVIPARLLIGPVAYLVYTALKKRPWSVPVAAAVGSMVNTVGTLSLAVVFGYIPLAGKEGAIAIGGLQGGLEALASAILLTPIVYAVAQIMRKH